MQIKKQILSVSSSPQRPSSRPSISPPVTTVLTSHHRLVFEVDITGSYRMTLSSPLSQCYAHAVYPYCWRVAEVDPQIWFLGLHESTSWRKVHWVPASCREDSAVLVFTPQRSPASVPLQTCSFPSVPCSARLLGLCRCSFPGCPLLLLICLAKAYVSCVLSKTTSSVKSPVDSLSGLR